MTEEVNLKIDKEILRKAKEILKKKHPLRKFKTWANVSREAMLDFIEQNKKHVKV